MNFRFCFFLISVVFYSCKGGNTTENSLVDSTETREKKDAIQTGILCRQNPSVTYSLYLPKNFDSSVSYPIIFCFDPHGTGSLPLNLYRNLADKFGFILIGSENSKNGMEFSQTQLFFKEMWLDISSGYKINSRRIYAMGFSGGAKVAGVLSSEDTLIKAVICCGAPPPVEVKNVPFFGFVGDGDFNYHEFKKYGETSNLLVHLFNGIHEWPPLETMHTAFLWLHIKEIISGKVSVDNSYLKNVADSINKVVGISMDVLSKMAMLKEAAYTFEGTAYGNDFQKRWLSNLKSLPYTSAKAEEENEDKKESSQQQYYQSMLMQKDTLWWGNEINTLKSKSDGLSKRLVAFISIMAYSATKQMLSTNQYESAAHFNTVFEMCDRSNEDYLKFAAQIKAAGK